MNPAKIQALEEEMKFLSSCQYSVTKFISGVSLIWTGACIQLTHVCSSPMRKGFQKDN
jgi:hypothetical protein